MGVRKPLASEGEEAVAMGDIGEPLKHIEVVPLTEPMTVPQPEEVPVE